MKQGRCLGLVGGLGPGATVHYYNALLRAHAAQGIAPDILIAHADLGRVLGDVGRGDNEGLARYLAVLIERLARAGAEVAAVAAVTPHICMPFLRGFSPLPLIDIAEELRVGLAGRGLGRIALFGTRFTVETGMFGQLAGFDVVRPAAAEIARVHDIYLAIVEAGAGTPPQLKELRRIAHGIIEREGVEAVVLAGTELSLVVDERSAGFPAVDCAGLHVAGIVRHLG